MRSRALARAAVVRAALAAAGWWALAEGGGLGGAAGVALAAATVAAAVAASLWLLPPRTPRLRLRRLPAFAWFFAHRSVVGGLDVARRALVPGGVVRPGYVEFPTRLPEGSPRALFMEVVSLLPGTLVAGERGDVMIVHVIDTDLPVLPSLRETERQVAALLGGPASPPA